MFRQTQFLLARKYANKIHLFTFGLMAMLYLAFPIKIHQWESYWYASGIESLFPAANIHHFFNVKLNTNLTFDIFNPNHPLLHLITYYLTPLFKDSRSLEITQFINLNFSLIGLWTSLQIALLLGFDRMKASLFILFLGTTNLYWYYSMSGEVYIAPTAMLICVLYFIISLEQKLELNISPKKELILIPIAFSLACSFHLLAAPFLLIIILSYWLYSKKYKTFYLNRSLIILFSIGVPWAILIYGFAMITFMNISSWKDYIDSILVLSSMNGSGNTILHENLLRNFIWHISGKTLSLLHALIRTHNIFTIAYKILFFVLGSISIISITKKRESISTFIISLWALIYIFIFTFIIKVPFNDYWLLALFPIIISICLMLKRFERGYLFFLVIFIFSQLTFNFVFDIFPKSKASLKDFSLLANYNNLVANDEHVYFYFDYSDERFFNEMWYVNYIKKNKKIFLLNDKTFINLKNIPPFKLPSKFLIVSPISDLYHSLRFNGSTDRSYLRKINRSSIDSLEFQNFQKDISSFYEIQSFIIGKNESIEFEKKAQYSPWHKDQYTTNYNLLIQEFQFKKQN